MVNIITKDALRASIEKFYDGFFDGIDFYALPRGIGFTGYRHNTEHTAYVELKQEFSDKERLNDVLESFKIRFAKDRLNNMRV